jgi:hypothetical protein
MSRNLALSAADLGPHCFDRTGADLAPVSVGQEADHSALAVERLSHPCKRATWVVLQAVGPQTYRRLTLSHHNREVRIQ